MFDTFRNPFENIRDAWADSVSVWGKTSVLIWYAYLWIFVIAFNVVSVAQPLSGAWECTVDADDNEEKTTTAAPLSTAWIAMLVRHWSLTMVFWALYVEQAGHTVTNVLAFLVLQAVDLIMWWTLNKPMVVAAGGGECANSFGGMIPQVFVPPLVVLLLLVVDRRIRRQRRDGGGSESEPLVS